MVMAPVSVPVSSLIIPGMTLVSMICSKYQLPIKFGSPAFSRTGLIIIVFMSEATLVRMYELNSVVASLASISRFIQTGYRDSKQTSNSSQLHASIRPVSFRVSLPTESPMCNSCSFRVTSSTCFLQDNQLPIVTIFVINEH